VRGQAMGRRTYPRRYSERELAKVGVEVRDLEQVILGCVRCGHGWMPPILPGGKLHYGYWKCSFGCNAKPDTTVPAVVARRS
jgi:hypothetical protein